MELISPLSISDIQKMDLKFVSSLIDFNFIENLSKVG